MLRLLLWIAKWAGRIATIIMLKRRGWKYLFGGLFLMFIVPMFFRMCS